MNKHQQIVTENGCDTITLNELQYRGEGNASIAFSIPSRRQILNVKKAERTSSCMMLIIETFKYYCKLEDPKKQLAAESVTNRFKQLLGNIIRWWSNILVINNETYNAKLSLKFYKSIMVPLLGEVYTSKAKSVYLSKFQVMQLEKQIDKSRPEFRKWKQLSGGQATIFADYAFLPKAVDDLYETIGSTLAIEIKPKQGWMSCGKRTGKCQFCRNQYLKLEKNLIQKISKYCPLDLFSGDPMRMAEAIRNLIDNPQNNLRLFCDGKLMFGEGMSKDKCLTVLQKIFQPADLISTDILVAEFINLLIEILKTPLYKQNCDHSCPIANNHNEVEIPMFKQTDNACAYNKSILPKECVLARILAVQQFDQIDVENFGPFYNQLQPNTSGELDYVELLLNELQKVNCPKCLIWQYINRTMSSVDHILQDLVPHLVASVATDCSLMISMKRIKQPHYIIQQNMKYPMFKTTFGTFIANIGTFDLYPKTLSTIPKHISRDKKLLQMSSLQCD